MHTIHLDPSSWNDFTLYYVPVEPVTTFGNNHRQRHATQKPKGHIFIGQESIHITGNRNSICYGSHLNQHHLDDAGGAELVAMCHECVLDIGQSTSDQNTPTHDDAPTYAALWLFPVGPGHALC
ncbi:hypothetical protein E8E14_005733 [Neopestalotiopsis sp. 37M]|nr:hypothetical protein E8E14_005733 [Neopestalotiopsis sp. 37M]